MLEGGHGRIHVLAHPAGCMLYNSEWERDLPWASCLQPQGRIAEINNDRLPAFQSVCHGENQEIGRPKLEICKTCRPAMGHRTALKLADVFPWPL